MYKSLEDYLENMRMFPSVKNPEILGHDGEFLYYKLVVPKQYVKYFGEILNRGTVSLSEGDNTFGLTWYPIYSGIVEIGSNESLVNFRVRVPKLFISSGLGVMYRGYDVW